jgi:uncharacterized protein YjbI with pentapeptide repeats
MNPQVEAALIAGIVSLISLGGTVIVASIGFRTTRNVTGSTLTEQRTRTLNERFATAAGQLGSDKPPAVRLAGVYAMAGLADDWEENRQTCVEVLCAYLRMPYERDPGDEAPQPLRLAFRASHEVRRTVIRVITAHLRDHAAKSWQGLNFDFTGAVFDGGDFSFAEFSGGEVSFWHAEFSGGEVVLFDRANFSGGEVDFRGARFSGGEVSFDRANFSGGDVDFSFAEFSGGMVDFSAATVSGGTVDFTRADFSGGTVGFRFAEFSGGEVGFIGAGFSGGTVGFNNATFSGGEVDFTRANFSGGTVRFDAANFSGGTVDFTDPGDWSFPPAFPWTDRPPLGVKLPRKESQSGA